MKYSEEPISESDMEAYRKVKAVLARSTATEREKKKLYMRTYRAGHRKKYLSYMKGWHARHREQQKAYMHAKYLTEREENNAHSRKWQKDNPEKLVAIIKAHSANRSYEGHLSARQVRAIIAKSNRICYWCRKSGLQGRDLTIEHLRPINDPRYIVIACLACNSGRKSHKQ